MFSLNLEFTRRSRRTLRTSCMSAGVASFTRSLNSFNILRAPRGRNEDPIMSPAPRSAGFAAMTVSSARSITSVAEPSGLESIPRRRRKKFLMRFVNISHAENLAPSGLRRDISRRNSGFVRPSARNSCKFSAPLKPGGVCGTIFDINVMS